MNKKITKQNYNAFTKILLETLMCTVLFNLAVLIPITSFGLLIYKIKNVPLFRKKEWLAVTVLSMVIIGGINIYIIPESYQIGVDFFSKESLLNAAGYALIFLPIEILYYIFNGTKLRIPVFDRIIITTIIAAFAGYAYIQMLNIDGKILKEILTEVNKIDSKDADILLAFMKKYAFSIIYTYMGMITYLTYYSFGKKSYKYWRISYQWLLLYIIPFFIIRFGHIHNLYLENIMFMVKISFVVYGIKIVYNFIRLKINSDLICQVLAVMIGFSFQNITFIIAGLLSFEAIKIKIIRGNGGK